MMLAALPGTVGDGGALTLDYGAGGTVTTRMGAKPTASTLKRFLVGPPARRSRASTRRPTARAVRQRPAPGRGHRVLGDQRPDQYQSHWPGNAGYGAGGATARPRAATVMISKDNGGRVGT